jgi:hypothetical protein
MITSRNVRELLRRDRQVPGHATVTGACVTVLKAWCDECPRGPSDTLSTAERCHRSDSAVDWIAVARRDCLPAVPGPSSSCWIRPCEATLRYSLVRGSCLPGGVSGVARVCPQRTHRHRRCLRSHGDDDLPSRMVRQHVGDGIRGITECVGFVDDHLDVAGFEQGGILTTSMPPPAKTASNEAVNWPARSRTGNRKSSARSPKAISRFRAC